MGLLWFEGLEAFDLFEPVLDDDEFGAADAEAVFADASKGENAVAVGMDIPCLP